MGLAHVVGTEAGRHRFHTLAFPGKQQAGAIGLQRDHAIQVPRGLRQAIQIGREAFLLGAWRNRMGAHDQQLNIQEWQTGWSFSSRYPVYNTVVLESQPGRELTDALCRTAERAGSGYLSESWVVDVVVAVCAGRLCKLRMIKDVEVLH